MGQSQTSKAIEDEKKAIDDYYHFRIKRDRSWDWTKDPVFLSRLSVHHHTTGMPSLAQTEDDLRRVKKAWDAEVEDRATRESPREWLERTARKNTRGTSLPPVPPKVPAGPSAWSLPTPDEMTPAPAEDWSAVRV